MCIQTFGLYCMTCLVYFELNCKFLIFPSGKTWRRSLLRTGYPSRLRGSSESLPIGFRAAAQCPGNVQPGLHARKRSGSRSRSSLGEKVLRPRSRSESRRQDSRDSCPNEAFPTLRSGLPTRVQSR